MEGIQEGIQEGRLELLLPLDYPRITSRLPWNISVTWNISVILGISQNISEYLKNCNSATCLIRHWKHMCPCGVNGPLSNLSVVGPTKVN